MHANSMLYSECDTHTKQAYILCKLIFCLRDECQEEETICGGQQRWMEKVNELNSEIMAFTEHLLQALIVNLNFISLLCMQI